MKLARVIGTLVLSPQVESYTGKTFHLTQDLDRDLQPVGEVEVSAAWQPVRQGELVIVEVAREAANAFEPPLPIDSVIIGKADKAHIVADE
ncbi:MAG: hypothetical protein GKR89_24070 [Candidatus Latescibacteria bacterium]|nr:hypothetical protein [Candidatus Latescibacterota bacterium]